MRPSQVPFLPFTIETLQVSHQNPPPSHFCDISRLTNETGPTGQGAPNLLALSGCSAAASRRWSAAALRQGRPCTRPRWGSNNLAIFYPNAGDDDTTL